MASESGLWIFGYGSLCWNPGFEFSKSTIGYVKGFGRRFWQGNTTHRGTLHKPGRVATLVENKEELVYGRAFEVNDNAALPYLEKRECSLGGYRTIISEFHTRNGESSFPVIVYIATEKNEHWLGDDDLLSIARQISDCSGPSGHNVEYLLRLADFMHRYFPDVHDEHLFTLEILVRAEIRRRKMCLETLMGVGNFVIKVEERKDEVSPNENDEDDANASRSNSFEYISRVPTKSLRCVKM